MIMSTALTIMAVFAVAWLLPRAFVVLWRRARGSAKAGWALLAMFFSWVGYAVFLVVNAERAAPVQHG
ncbi:hypothetical protein [Dokdonella sp.]|uniref:hypothetical protein n=1 Tax=Dokdonella sp. TaxID=2291710 RepID=UPI002F3E78ED